MLDPGTVRSHHPTNAPPQPVTEGEQEGLLRALAAVPDPRSPRGLRYPLAGLLAVAVCAVMAGASSMAAIADWLHDLDVDAHAIDPACARDGRAALPSPDAAATIFRAEAGGGAGDPPTPSSLRF